MTMQERSLNIGLGWAGTMRPSEYAELASAAEKAGVDSLVVYSDLMFQTPLGPLLEMASATERVALGLGCLSPYTIHPVEIASQFAYLDLVSRGRASLGLVRGAWLDRLGLDQHRAISAVRDTWEIVSRLLAGDRTGYKGRVFELAGGLELQYEPHRRSVPLTIGTWSPKMAHLAGEVAAEVEVGGTANPDMIAVIRSLVQPGATSVGRSAEDLRVSFNPMMVVDDDGAQAESLARRAVAMYVAVVGPHDPTLDLDPELLARMSDLVDRDDHEAAGRLIGSDILRKFLVCGTPTQVVDHLLSLRDAGLDSVYLGNPFGLNESSGLKILTEKILPALRGGRDSTN